MQEAIFKIG